jgi:hypothetical protein
VTNAIGASLSYLRSSDHEEDGECKADAEEDSGLGKLSEYDYPSWVLGTISKQVQQQLDSLGQKLMTYDELSQPG